MLPEFDDYLRFGSDEEAPKSERSRRAYCWSVEYFLRFLEGEEPTPERAKDFIKRLEANGNKPTSINRHIWALKSFFKFLGKEEFKLRGLTTTEHQPRYLIDEEMNHLLAVTLRPLYDPEMPERSRQKAKKELALLYAYCGGGLRCSEALRLERDDVLDEGFLRITRKGGKEDFVPIEDEVLRALKDYIDSNGGGRYVFPGKAPDSHMAERTAQGIIKDLARRAGMPDVHIHSLRHTAGYQLRKLGASERDIQDVLGHKNIATTRIYTHLARDDLRARLPKRFNDARQGKLG